MEQHVMGSTSYKVEVSEITARAAKVGFQLTYDPQHGQYLLIPLTGSRDYFTHSDTLRQVEEALAVYERRKAVAL